MKLLKVQEYLLTVNNSLETLKRDFSIEYRINGDKVSLNYNQISSPMGEVLVQECRGLILNNKTFDIIAYPFKKFFNIEEPFAAKIDILNSFSYEKLDGSLLVLSYYNGWSFSTRSMCEAEGTCNAGISYKDLALEAFKRMGIDFEVLKLKLNKRYTYMFELQTPHNHIVIYSENYKITLIGVRDLDTLEELPIENIASELGFLTPKEYIFHNYNEISNFLESWNKDKIEHEGFVLLDKDFNRVKIKAEAYKAAHGILSSIAASPRNMMKLILLDNVDDLSFVKDGLIINRLNFFIEKVKALIKTIESDWDKYKDIKVDKEFALLIINLPYKAALFSLRRNKVNSISEFIKSCSKSDSSIDRVINWCKII